MYRKTEYTCFLERSALCMGYMHVKRGLLLPDSLIYLACRRGRNTKSRLRRVIDQFPRERHRSVAIQKEERPTVDIRDYCQSDSVQRRCRLWIECPFRTTSTSSTTTTTTYVCLVNSRVVASFRRRICGDAATQMAPL